MQMQASNQSLEKDRSHDQRYGCEHFNENVKRRPCCVLEWVTYTEKQSLPSSLIEHHIYNSVQEFIYVYYGSLPRDQETFWILSFIFFLFDTSIASQLIISINSKQQYEKLTCPQLRQLYDNRYLYLQEPQSLYTSWHYPRHPLLCSEKVP